MLEPCPNASVQLEGVPFSSKWDKLNARSFNSCLGFEHFRYVNVCVLIAICKLTHFTYQDVWMQRVDTCASPTEALVRETVACFFQLLVAADWLACGHINSSLYSCLHVVFCLCRMETFVIGFRTPLDNQGWWAHLKILNLTIPTRTLFSNKVIVTL